MRTGTVKKARRISIVIILSALAMAICFGCFRFFYVRKQAVILSEKYINIYEYKNINVPFSASEKPELSSNEKDEMIDAYIDAINEICSDDYSEKTLASPSGLSWFEDEILTGNCLQVNYCWKVGSIEKFQHYFNGKAEIDVIVSRSGIDYIWDEKNASYSAESFNGNVKYRIYVINEDGKWQIYNVQFTPLV